MSQTIINALFEEVAGDGDLSTKSLQILTGPMLGQQMQAALGVSVDDVGAADDVIVTGILIDDTGSIGSDAPAVIDGHNLVVDALSATKQANSILMTNRYMYAAQAGAGRDPSAGVLYPFVNVKNATKMDRSNYAANGMSTPLYDQSLALLGSVVAKVQEFAQQGVAARSITLLVTDGGDNISRHSAADVAAVVKDMLKAEKHIVAFLGIGDDSSFRQIAKEMGIPDNWILTTGNSASEIRQAFRMFSQSAVRASQNAATSFSQNAGFWS